jgi:flagellar motility protein MotE (MotC chaperone)
MKKPANRRLITLAAILILGAAALAIAQTQPAQQVEPVQLAMNQEFDRQTLENYAAVSVELGEIELETAQKLQDVKDQKKAMEIAQEAARKKVSVIEEQGLDLQTYNQIDARVKVDPELEKEIEQIRETGGN